MLIEYFVIHILTVTVPLPDGTMTTGDMYSVMERKESKKRCKGRAAQLNQEFPDFPGRFECLYDAREKGRI